MCVRYGCVLQICSSSNVNYFGTSADEVALLESLYTSTKYFIDTRVCTASGDQLLLHTREESDERWEVIQLFKYTSAKGKMTVIVRNQHTKQVLIVTKGSPERMYACLREDHQAEAQRIVSDLARHGLRVLLYAQKEITWSDKHERGLGMYVCMYVCVCVCVCVWSVCWCIHVSVAHECVRE
jgi:magnesium-transporting ATPase (P-type)